MTYLLDTNVISELRRRHPDPSVAAWYDTVQSAEIFISALTVGEIRLGIERLRKKDSGQADRLEHWLQGLRAAYGDHIIGIDTAVAEEWAASMLLIRCLSSTACSLRRPRSAGGRSSPATLPTWPAAP